MEDDKLENDEKIEERSSDDDEIEEGGSLGLFVKKSKGKKKKCGRKSPWTSEDIDDFIDIVVSNTYCKESSFLQTPSVKGMVKFMQKF